MNKSKAKSKKSDKHASRKDDRGSIDSKPKEVSVTSPTVTTPLMSPVSSKPSSSLWFSNEVQHMMFGFGDCRKPLQECAALVEQVVHQQLSTLLHKAGDVAAMRNGRFISIEDFLFLMRHDKNKLKRFLKYMAIKDMRSGCMDDDDSHDSGSDSKQPSKKKKKICYEFLSSIDQNGELLALFEDTGVDEIKKERQMRAELQVRNMDTEQYFEFCEARQASFAPRYKSQKFRDWLLIGNNVEPKPNPLAIEVLAYLAFETVAQIVDLALLVRKDSLMQADDSLSCDMPAATLNLENLHSAHVIQLQVQKQQQAAAAAAACKSPSWPGSPTSSSPTTPTTPSPMTSPTVHAVTTPLSLPNSNSSSKSKPSKRQKKGGANSSKDLYYTQALQPSHFREAIRRYSQSVGPFAAFSKEPLFSAKEKVLCL